MPVTGQAPGRVAVVFSGDTRTPETPASRACQRPGRPSLACWGQHQTQTMWSAQAGARPPSSHPEAAPLRNVEQGLGCWPEWQ